MMADWERLGPKKPTGSHCLLYRHDKVGREITPGWQDDDSIIPLAPGFDFSDPELDALATKSEKVRALALIARECLALMRLRMIQDAGLGRDRVMERACDVLEDALAKFEHV